MGDGKMAEEAAGQSQGFSKQFKVIGGEKKVKGAEFFEGWAWNPDAMLGGEGQALLDTDEFGEAVNTIMNEMGGLLEEVALEAGVRTALATLIGGALLYAKYNVEGKHEGSNPDRPDLLA